MALQPGEAIQSGAIGTTYNDIVGALRRDLMSIHEISCAAGDMLDVVKRHSDAEVGQLLATSNDVNYRMMIALEGMLSSLASVEANADTILFATLTAHPRTARRMPWKQVALWFALGAVLVLATIAAGWVGGVRAGALVGYSRAFDDLAGAGMIEIKRHGDTVDLTMGPNNPVGRDKPSQPRPSMRLGADKVPVLR